MGVQAALDIGLGLGGAPHRPRRTCRLLDHACAVRRRRYRRSLPRNDRLDCVACAGAAQAMIVPVTRAGLVPGIHDFALPPTAPRPVNVNVNNLSAISI